MKNRLLATRIAAIAALAISPFVTHTSTITFDDIGVPGRYIGLPGFIDQGYDFGGGASDIDISSTSP